MEFKTLKFTVEALSTPYKYTWQYFHDDRAAGAFVLPDNSWIDLYITISTTLSMDVVAEVIFSRNTDDTIDDYSINNKGDAFRIFATVMAMMNEYLKKYGDGISKVEFSAEKHDDPTGSRAKLYDKLIKRFIPRGWKYEEKVSNSRAVIFRITNLNFDIKKSIFKNYKL